MTANPAIILVSDSVAGGALFHGKGRCFTCHGQRGEGIARLGPSLADSIWLDNSGSIAGISSAVAHGVASPKAFSVAMPAYHDTMTPEEISQVAAYVYTLSHPGATATDTIPKTLPGASNDSAVPHGHTSAQRADSMRVISLSKR